MDKISTTRRALFSAPAVAALPLSPAAAHPVAELQRRLHQARAHAEAAPEWEEDELWSRTLVADAIEDQIRALPCTSMEVAVAHSRILAREVACGQRLNSSSISHYDLADGVLHFFGEVF